MGQAESMELDDPIFRGYQTDMDPDFRRDYLRWCPELHPKNLPKLSWLDDRKLALLYHKFDLNWKSLSHLRNARQRRFERFVDNMIEWLDGLFTYLKATSNPEEGVFQEKWTEDEVASFRVVVSLLRYDLQKCRPIHRVL